MDIVNTVMGCCPVSNKFIPSASVQTLVIDQTPKKGLLDVQETGMQKWAGMLVETCKAFVDPSAMMTQMREDSDLWSLPPLTILCWRTHLVITKHPEDGPDIAQMDNTTTRMITSK